MPYTDPELQRAAGRKHYQNNKAAVIAARQRTREATRVRNRKIILDHLIANPCVDCGEADPIVLEFDHREDKSFQIGDMGAKVGLARLLAEIAKCDVRCANCHRRKSYHDRGGTNRTIH